MFSAISRGGSSSDFDGTRVWGGMGLDGGEFVREEDNTV